MTLVMCKFSIYDICLFLYWFHLISKVGMQNQSWLLFQQHYELTQCSPFFLSCVSLVFFCRMHYVLCDNHTISQYYCTISHDYDYHTTIACLQCWRTACMQHASTAYYSAAVTPAYCLQHCSTSCGATINLSAQQQPLQRCSTACIS